MYLTFPTKYSVHIHDSRTGMVIANNTVPEAIESGYFQGEDQFIITGTKRIFVFRRLGRNRQFSLYQTRLKTI